MKKCITALLICWALQGFAQGSYYDSLNDSLRCQQLKGALKKLISTGYIERTYTDATGFMQTYDRKLNDAGTFQIIWDMYSDNPSGAEPYEYRINTFCSNESASNENVCWNREHCLPASWFNNATPTYSDIVNLIPSDAYVNNRRSNNPYGKVGTSSFTSLNGSKLGNSSTSGISGTVFEPIDPYKGDFARIMLYMITRYEDSLSKWGGADAGRVLGTDPFKGFKTEYLDLMINWHNQDPPSQKEKDRNNAIQIHQGNRNPYVDRPQYVDYIWKTSVQDCENFSVGIRNNLISNITLYPNPVTYGQLNISDLNILGRTYQISDLTGRIVSSGIISTSYIEVDQLSNGYYQLIIQEQNSIKTGKFFIQN